MAHRVVSTGAVLLAIALMAAGASAQSAAVKVEAGKGKAEAAALVEIEVTVVSVDVKKREVQVRYDDGQVETLGVSEEVKRLGDVRPGDKVGVKYYRSLALSLEKTEGAGPSVSESGEVVRTKPTELPGGVRTKQITAVGRVTAIDPKAGTITLTGPGGGSLPLEADPQLIAKLAVGDLVKAVYTEALAVSISREAGH